MTTPWTPPGEELPERADQPWPAAPPPYQPPYQPPYRPTGYQPQPGFHGPAYPGGPHPDGIPPSKTMANWALGLTIVGCCLVTWVVGVVLAIVVLVQAREDPRDRGQSRAIAALVIGGVWALLLVLRVALGIVSGIDDAGQDPLGPDRQTTSKDGTTRVLPAKLRVGDCFDDEALAGVGPGDDSVQTGLVTRVPCPQLHDFEAFETFVIPGTDFPGRDEVRRQASVRCGKAFKPYVGIAYGPSDLDFWVYYPTSRSWAVLDDHGVTCVLGEPGKQTAGSLRGSRR